MANKASFSEVYKILTAKGFPPNLLITRGDILNAITGQDLYLPTRLYVVSDFGENLLEELPEC